MAFPRQACIWVLLLAALFPSAAKAADSDVEAAKRRFAAGREYYQAGHYEEALLEFRAARIIKPLPDFDYNIGRCLDNLERYDEAIAAYEDYLSQAQGAADVPAVRARIQVLRARRVALRAVEKQREANGSPVPASSPAAPPPATTDAQPRLASPLEETPIGKDPPNADPPRASGARFTVPAVVGVAALAVLGTGLGLELSIDSEYDRLVRSCSPNCERSQWKELQTREWAGVALLGVGGAALAADVVIWAVIGARRRSSVTRDNLKAGLWLVPTASSGSVGLAAGGAFQ